MFCHTGVFGFVTDDSIYGFRGAAGDVKRSGIYQ